MNSVNCLMEKKKKLEVLKLKLKEKEIVDFSKAYRDVFNGAPFYEDWTLSRAFDVIKDYIDDGAFILASKYMNRIIGFLVAVNEVPVDQREYVQKLEFLRYIEEIGVLAQYRNNGIATKMVNALLMNYLNNNIQYIGYRTNAMRYFDYNGAESFESKIMRVQEEDRIKRIIGEKIDIPDFNDYEKQKFINKYIELIKYRPDLDVSNSNALFRSIMGNVDFSKINGNYSFQKDPTGEGNDRIFPIINLGTSKVLVRRR